VTEQQAPWEDADKHCALITATLDKLGITYVELGFHLGASGIGIAWTDDNYVVVAVDSGGVMYISSGVSGHIVGERLTILDTCNDFNQEQVTPVMFLYQDEDDQGVPWRQSVLLQQKYPVPLVTSVPRFFEATLNMMPELTSQARQLLVDRGIRGTPYLWNDEQARLLLQQGI
jgi:hypothetical protein